MNRIILTTCLIALIISCATSSRTYKCTGGNMVFSLEGASEYMKGYIRVNDSDRVATLYRDSAVESRWYWGAYVNSNSTIFDNSKHRYIILLEASGAGVFLNTETGSEVALSCGALND